MSWVWFNVDLMDCSPKQYNAFRRPHRRRTRDGPTDGHLLGRPPVHVQRALVVDDELLRVVARIKKDAGRIS